MSEFLQIIGSIASITGIPLAVFLYLRQREAKYRRLRVDICKSLSYKIGENSEITLFELESIIETKAREYGINPSRVSPDGVVKDLVTETISNPMLNSERKGKVVQNLQNIHQEGISKGFDIEPNGKKQLEEKDLKVRHEFKKLSTVFGILAGGITGILGMAVITDTKAIITFFKENYNFLIGILGSIIAAIILYLVTMIMKIATRFKKKIIKKK